MSILLETKGLTKKYKNGIALNHVSIQVEKGTVYFQSLFWIKKIIMVLIRINT